jgi:hypothetical protein
MHAISRTALGSVVTSQDMAREIIGDIVQAYKDNADEIGLEPEFRFEGYDAVVVSITGEIRHSGDNTLAGTLDISAGYRVNGVGKAEKEVHWLHQASLHNDGRKPWELHRRSELESFRTAHADVVYNYVESDIRHILELKKIAAE